MPNEIANTYAKCPFFRRKKGSSISCEYCDENEIILSFSSGDKLTAREKCDKYAMDFCYKIQLSVPQEQQCPIYKTVYDWWENK